MVQVTGIISDDVAAVPQNKSSVHSRLPQPESESETKKSPASSANKSNEVSLELNQSSSSPGVSKETPKNGQESIDSLNQSLSMNTASLRFKIDKEADRVVIQVVDSETGELIRQIPSDEMLSISKRLGEYLASIHSKGESSHQSIEPNLSSKDEAKGVLVDRRI
jgi:flagellar protein FlaG